MKNRIFLTVTLFALLFNGFSQEISEWRGAGRTGVYNEQGLLKMWPEKGPELLWSNDSLPSGYSSMSIANNTIYLTGLKAGIDMLIALDMSGIVKWQTPIGKAWLDSFSDSRSTPTVEGDRVYVSSGMGMVACFDAISGQEIWKVNGYEKFDGRYGSWGYSESLLLVDDKVIFTPCGEKTTIVALDKKTGSTIWQSLSMKDTVAYVSPLLVQEGGKKLIVTVTGTYLLVVNAENGEILSSSNYGGLKNEKAYKVWPGASYTNTNTPIYKDHKIYITGGYDHVGAMYSLSTDFKTLTLDWTDETLDVHHGGAVLIDGYIYGSNWINNRIGKWCCIDWKTGKTMYEKEWKTKGSIIANDGMLYCYEEKTGFVALVKATPEDFAIVSSFQVPLGKGPCWSHPTIKDGILYIRRGGALMAYKIK
ncbi:MAG: alcohol dehydrogenase [Bacteroidales bacterium]|nr:MAG: alcohol dehydrogenase [Bacteroidales bacterium]